MLLLLLLVAGVTNTLAQNVTVKTTNGNTIPGVKQSGGNDTNDTFYKWGGFAIWKHNQLNLTMSTTDKDEYFGVTDYAQFSNPANNIFKSSGEALQLARGRNQDCYVAFTLPKGYRFTKYTIVFRRNINRPNGDKVDNDADGDNGSASFGEVVPGAANTDWGWNGDKYVTGLTYNASASTSTITRTNLSEENPDMGNALYFKLTNNTSERVFLTLEKIEFNFTAEADYTPFTPAGTFLNRTAVDVPFSTSTVDLGVIESRNYNGRDRISYDFSQVKDLMANLTLFEEESVEPGENYDGISGDVVKYADNGTISQQGQYFKVGRTGNAEQIYYIESPTYVKLANGTKNPIGYRITGAKIYYTYGEATPAHQETVKEEVFKEAKTYPTFTISQEIEVWEWVRTWTSSYWESLGNRTYYLTSTGGISETESEMAVWFRDENGYIRSAANPDKYLKQGTNNTLQVVELGDRPGKYNINDNGQITIQGSTSNMILGLNVRTETNGGGWGSSGTTHVVGVTAFRFINNATYPAPRTLTGQEKTINIFETVTRELNFPAFTPSNYTLTVYDKEGNELNHVDVKADTEDGYLEIPDMNNDAVKIGVTGVGLIRGDITMQALDPYINRMSIVCNEAALGTDGTYAPTGNGLSLTQTFNASDFTVKGEAFYFYIPEDFKAPCLLTFENLYSDYGDKTYYNKTDSKNNARYSFVKSPYWTDNSDLYATTYDPDHEYTEKVNTLVKGTKEFTFNNAGTVGSTGGSYEEYPFSLVKYAAEGGDFDQLYFTNAEMTPTQGQPATQKTAYLFTCDETRYNISKATATQHRTYAFYEMKITAQRQDYAPKLEWTKIYDENKTLYKDGNTVKKDAQYGLTLKAVDKTVNTKEVEGYLTVSQVKNAITTITGIVQNLGKTLTDENRKFDIDKDNDIDKEDLKKASNVNEDVDAPESTEQILYVDGSKLLSIVENSEKQEGSESVTKHTLAEIQNGLGANALIYLPLGQVTNAPSTTETGSGSGTETQTTTVTFNNFATKMATDRFEGAGNFILTDMKPFYAPYDIDIPAANTAEYKRMITKSTYGQETTCTLILPFNILVENGKHTNLDGSEFTLHKMQATNSLVLQGGTTYAYMPSAFGDVTETTEQNKPYIVKLKNVYSADPNLSFVVTQNGATIKATAGIMNDNYTITDKDAEGKVITSEGTAIGGDAGTTEGTTYTFTNKGTYAGIEIDKGQDVFYFARNNFVCSKSLNDNYSTVKVAPFRAFYTWKADGAAKLMSFDMIFNEGLGDTPTGISSLNANPDLKVVPGNGVITMTSAIEQNVRVNSTSGVLVSNAKLQAGETQIINVPAGVYVINGVKIIVK